MGTAILKVPLSTRTPSLLPPPISSPSPEASGLLACPLLPPCPRGPTPAFLVLILPTGSLGDCRDSGKVIFLNRRTEIFKRRIYGRKGSPCGWHTNSSLSWSQRGRPQTGNHKSLQPGHAAGTLWFVVAGRRPEVLYLLTKMGKGRGESPEAEAFSCPPCSPSLSLSGGVWDTKMGGWAVRCLWSFDFWNNWAWRADDAGLYSVATGGGEGPGAPRLPLPQQAG